MKRTILWTAIITPLDTHGKIDFKSFEALLRSQEKASNGVVLLGSTGEGMALSRIEKETILNFVQGLRLSIPCISGLPGHNLEDTLDFIRFAKTTGIKGFLAVTPYYSKPGVEGQTSWFKAILDEASLPVMLYNVPSRTGIRLAPNVISELKMHPHLWAVKESSGSVESFLEYQEANPNLAFYCGDDGLMPEFAKHGAVGLVSVASNVWPTATRKVVELSLAKKAQDFTDLWQECTNTLFLSSNPVPVKWLQRHLGQISDASVRAPLALSDLKDTRSIVQAHTKIKNWLKERESL